MRWVFWSRASWALSNAGSTRLFSTRVLADASSDQGTTSPRSGSGGNGLFGLCTPGPVPMGTGGLNCAPAEAAIKTASRATAFFMVELPGIRSMFVLQAAVFSNGQAFASGLKIFQALVGLLSRLQAFGRRFMGGCHGPMAPRVLLDLFGAFRRHRQQRQPGRQHHHRHQF